MTLLLRLMVLLVALCPGAAADPLDEIFAHDAALEKLQQLSKARRYATIFDSLAPEYRDAVDRDSWLKRSIELGWTITEPEIGTFTAHGDTAYAPVRSKTVIGGRVHHVDAVAFFVRKGGVWRFWSFPFVPTHLTDCPSWPPPAFRPNQSLEPTPHTGR